VDSIISSAMQRALDRPKGKVDWSQSPYRDVKGEKNAVGDFGEYVYQGWCNKEGDLAEIVRKYHDVKTVTKKTEVKTAFQNKSGTFFFNQIYYHNPETGEEKDWDTLAFVFVWPHRVEVWECSRPENPDEEFGKNNGYCWNKSSPNSLSKIWTKVYEWAE
jgi:hypothetical protein